MAMSAPSPSSPATYPASRQACWAAGAASALSFAVYVATLAPSLVEGDNPELVTAVHTLGVPHPTGYPLLLLVGKALESALPIGSPALRLNLVGALFGALAAGVLAWTAARASGRSWCGWLAGAWVGLGQGLWSQSVAFEVYSLHALLLALLLAALVRWEQLRTPRAALAVALAAGLSLTHHRTALFFAFPAWLAVVVGTKEGWRLAPRLLLAAAAPNLLYLVLFPLSWRQPALDWGSVNLGWAHWLAHVAGLQYRLVALGRPLPAALQVAGTHWSMVLDQYTWVVPLLALVGLAAIRRRPLAAVTLCGALLSALWAYLYNVSDTLTLALPSELMLAFWAALGAGAIVSWRERIQPRRRWAWLAAGLGTIFAGYLLWSTWPLVDQSQQWAVHDECKLALACLPPHAILLTHGDTANGAMLYLQQVEGVRPDVAAASAMMMQHPSHLPNLRWPPLRAAAAAHLAAWQVRPGKDYWEFCWRLVDEVMARRQGRPLFTLFPRPAWSPRYAWQDDGLLQEVLVRWPSLQVADSGPGVPGVGMACLGVTAAPRVVRRGEPFRLQCRWRLDRPLDKRVAVRATFSREGAADEEARAQFVRNFPLCYGKRGLPASSAGQAYLQSVPCLAPSNAQVGKYLLLLSVTGKGLGGKWLYPVGLEITD